MWILQPPARTTSVQSHACTWCEPPPRRTTHDGAVRGIPGGAVRPSGRECIDRSLCEARGGDRWTVGFLGRTKARAARTARARSMGLRRLSCDLHGHRCGWTNSRGSRGSHEARRTAHDCHGSLRSRRRDIQSRMSSGSTVHGVFHARDARFRTKVLRVRLSQADGRTHPIDPRCKEIEACKRPCHLETYVQYWRINARLR
mmetsp:Transcript_7586/g.46665  ORF Transcript_7586/g.46665 Transcript_7586/m.46665 type:complete len:201 (+) Transcript_7586:1336-1938(+)